jgi:homeobox protein cut-like
LRLQQPSPGRTSPIPFSSSADTSILPIVTSQRDRFRARNAELEDELRKQFQTLSSLRGEIKALQADNLKLYEKVRYMQSYREDAKSGGSGLGSGGGRRELTGGSGGAMSNGHADGDELSGYREQYEASVNPFQAFRGRVSLYIIVYTQSN